jgi:hypothetical protein
MDPVFDERVDVIIEFGNDGIFSSFALNPIPACVIGTVLVLADSDEVYAGIEHASPPPAVPGKIRGARKVRIDSETIVDLARPARYQVIG